MRQPTRDSIDEFDPGELIGRPLAQGSPAPGRPPQRPASDYALEQDNFDLEFESSSPSQATRQMSPDVVEALATRGSELDGQRNADRSPRWGESLDDARALDAQLDDVELDDEIDRQVARELARTGAKPEMIPDDLPFDPAEARAFDEGVQRAASQVSQLSRPRSGSDRSAGQVIGPASGETDATYVSGFDETEQPVRPVPAVDSSSYDAVPDDALHMSGAYDPYGPYGTESVQTPTPLADPTSSHTVSSAFTVTESPSLVARPATSMEDDLEEAEFFAGQGLFAEAIEVLNTLLTRFPGQRLVLAKLREIEAMATGGDAMGDAMGDALGNESLDIDDLEEMAPDELVELDSHSHSQPVAAPRKRQPTVMLERPVDEGDADTHYDLGLAYKEMTLYDDAIKAFEKALRAPGREVGCRVMIGMCLREMGNPSDAIHQFKEGLHARPTERERQSLYYEIGVTYEVIGDDAEALYFFEMVLKRDSNFADTAVRAERLRARGGRAQHARDDDL
jgi:hypothetical protein